MRQAIYFAPPPASLLHSLGSRWLGRDAVTGEALPQPGVDGIAAATGEPRRYGFHATLKPPFALREEIEADALLRAAAALAADEAVFRVPLTVGVLDGFLALVPHAESPELDRLAARCVSDLDGFRRAPPAAELARRRAARLTPRQEENLIRWGYPYVFADFRFHMTLSERLAGDAFARLRTAAEEHFAPALMEPVAIDGIALFQEAEPGAPFLAVRHFPFPLSKAEAAA